MKPDHLGHVHLKVRDLEAQEAFYKKILGVKVTQKVKNEFVFLSLGKHHHDIALMNIGKQAPTPDFYSTGLYHFAFELKNKKEFKKFYNHLKKHKIEVSPVDHSISIAMYFNDPEHNTIELYVDTRKTAKSWDGTVPLTDKEIQKF